MEKLENKTLYSLKFIACMFIVFIHIPFPGGVGIAVKNFARFAVPLFFMISGYYTYFKDKQECNDVIYKRIIKLLKITICACIFYILFNIIFKLFFGRIDWYLEVICSWQNLYRLVLFNNTNWLEVVHLWYLFAILYVYLLFKAVNRFNLQKMAYVYSAIAIVAVCFVLIYDLFNECNIDPMYYRNAYFLGLPFFMLGHFIHSKEDKIKKIFNNKDYLFIIFCLFIIAIFIVENKYIWSSIELYTSSVLTVSLMFCYAICHPNVSIFYEFGKNYSLIIYIVHCAFSKVIVKLIDLRPNSIEAYIYPLIILFLSLLTGVIYKKIILQFFLQKKLKE